jgi:parallel beta-helix repeat protein
VQLGLGEFAGAARIAYTQGVDLFSIANNRLALGYEYTAQFLAGEKPHCYGVISERAKDIRDDYESVYRHYTSKGLEMPYTKIAAEKARAKADRSILTAFRSPVAVTPENVSAPKASPIAFPAGALEKPATNVPSGAIIVNPGESIQDALDKASKTDGFVLAKAGLHTLPATLKLPGNVTLAGEGLSTVLFLDPNSGMRDAIVNADSFTRNVTIRDLVIEGSLKSEPGTDPNSSRSFRGNGNRGGIILRASREGDMKNIGFINISVLNCTFNGVMITGAVGVDVIGCNFTENGSTVIPGPQLQHNLLLSHCSNVTIKDSRLDTSPFGSGIALVSCKTVEVISNEIARNGYYGVDIQESANITLAGNLIENNDRSGVILEFLSKGNQNVEIKNNIIHYNNGFGIESYSTVKIKLGSNNLTGNSSGAKQSLISEKKKIVMQ